MTFQISRGKMNYSVMTLDHMLTLGKIKWDSVLHISVTFCYKTRQAPNPRGLKTTTIYSVHFSVGQQFGLDSPKQLFLRSWPGSFMCLLLSVTNHSADIFGNCSQIISFTSLEVSLLSPWVMESNRVTLISSPSRLLHMVTLKSSEGVNRRKKGLLRSSLGTGTLSLPLRSVGQWESEVQPRLKIPPPGGQIRDCHIAEKGAYWERWIIIAIFATYHTY